MGHFIFYFRTKFSLLVCTSLIFSGCMKATSSLTQSSLTATEALGCQNLKSKVFDSMYSYLDHEHSTPNLNEFKIELSDQIDLIVKKQKLNDPEKLTEFKNEFFNIFDLLIEESKKTKNITSVKEHLQTLIELEMQDQSTDENITLNSKISKQFSKVSELSAAMNIDCQNEVTTAPQATTPINAQSRMIAGQNNVFSTAYQSCQTLQIPELSTETADVLGIRRIGTHADGIGGVREINDLKAVQNTHPYIRVAAGNQNGCFNVRANPLIYDYGGEPSVANNTINFFKNVGTGSGTLGIDCSAYVSSAIGVAGFRYKPGIDNKAIYIRQSSTKFIDAKKSGFTCFDNITVQKADSIKPGDIASVRGHVVMVDKVSADPFGLKKLSSISQCDAIDITNFDFTISQSSPSKNGLGINKFIAKDYLRDVGEFGKMRILFTSVASSACKAYFQNKAIKPTSSEWGIIRHNGNANCLAPRIQMANQSCVSQCQN